MSKREQKETARFMRDIIKVTMNEVQKIKCKYCDSKNVVRFGTYKGVQRYYCKACKRKFSLSDTLSKMKTPIRIIADALSMYYGGMSLNAISRHIEHEYGQSVTNAGIYNWLIRFSKDAVRLANKYTPKVGDVWIADETALNIGRSHRVWYWDIIDAKTRFLLATHISTKRTTADALTLMKKAEARASKIPELVFTDKLQAYLDGIEIAWGADAKHIPSKGFEAPMNTNLIERFHGSLKDRTKVMRGLRNKASANLLLEGWLVYYNFLNFLRPHESLKGKTPAEAAGIQFPYKNWADIVRSNKEVTVVPEKDKYPSDKTYRLRIQPVKKKSKRKAKPEKTTSRLAIATSKIKRNES